MAPGRDLPGRVVHLSKRLKKTALAVFFNRCPLKIPPNRVVAHPFTRLRSTARAGYGSLWHDLLYVYQGEYRHDRDPAVGRRLHFERSPVYTGPRYGFRHALLGPNGRHMTQLLSVLSNIPVFPSITGNNKCVGGGVGRITNSAACRDTIATNAFCALEVMC